MPHMQLQAAVPLPLTAHMCIGLVCAGNRSLVHAAAPELVLQADTWLHLLLHQALGSFWHVG